MSHQSDTEGSASRRSFLKASGAGAVALGMAGCGQGDDGESPSPTMGGESPTDTSGMGDGEIPEGGTFTYGMVSKPDSANVTQSSSVYSAVALGLVYEGPVASDPATFQAKPWLYTDWTIENTDSEEGPDAYFNMREDVEFGDGEPVTKEDVLFTYDYIVGNEIAEYASATDNIATDEDGNVLVEESDRDDWDFHAKLTQTVLAWPLNTIGAVDILPKHIWEGKDPQNFDPLENDQAVGMGPGKLTKFDPDTSMQVQIVNDNYREVLNNQQWVQDHEMLLAGGPFIDTFNFQIFGSESAQDNAFMEGEIDTYYGSVSTSLRSQVLDTEGRDLVKGFDSGFGYFGFNLTRQPLDDLTFRQAVNFTFDETFFVQTLQNNTVIKGDYPQSPGYPAGRPETYHDAELLTAPETELYSFRQGSPGVVDVEGIRNFLTSGKVANGDGGTYAGQEYPGTFSGDVRTMQSESKYDYTFGDVQTDILQNAATEKEIRINGQTIPEFTGRGPIQIITDPPAQYPRQVKAMNNWVQNLRSVGIPVELRILSFNTLESEVFYNQTYDITELGWGGSSPYGASNYFFFHSNFYTEGNEAFDYNYMGMGAGDLSMDEELSDAYTTLDTEEASQKFAKTMERAYLESPYRVYYYDKFEWPLNTAEWAGAVDEIVDPAFANWGLEANNLHKKS